MTIADLNADGRRPECRVVDDRCEVWKKIVRVRKDACFKGGEVDSCFLTLAYTGGGRGGGAGDGAETRHSSGLTGPACSQHQPASVTGSHDDDYVLATLSLPERPH